MPTFSVCAHNVLVGHTALEHGDPPMGVAFGVFLPSDGYASIRRECMSNHADQSLLILSIHTAAGATIPCEGVAILDYSMDMDPPYAEVHVLGIPHPPYGELFPEHIASYERRCG